MVYKEGDVLIKDSEIYEFGKHVKISGRKIDDALQQYHQCLLEISNEGIMSGTTHDALQEYIKYSEKIINIVNVVGDKCLRLSNQFIDLIDKQDDYLYKKGGAVVRDFSDTEYHNLKRMFKDEGKNMRFDGGILDRVGDAIIGKMIDWGCYDVSKVGINLDWAHKALMDYNDASWSDIQKIFSRVRNFDRERGTNTLNGFDGGYYRIGSFPAVKNFFWALRRTIGKMEEIISPQNGKFSVDTIKSELSPLFEELMDDLNVVVQIEEIGNDVSISSITNFAEKWKDISFFQQYYQTISEFISEHNTPEQERRIIFFNGVEISTKSLTKIFSVPIDIEFDEIYAYLMYKRSIAEAIEEITGSIDMEFFDTYDNAKEIVDAFLKGADMTGLSESYVGILEKISDALSTGKKVIDKAEEYAEMLTCILSKYMEGEAVLKSFSEGLTEGSLSQIAVRELLFEYEHDFVASIQGTLNFILSAAMEDILDEGIDIALSFAGENAKGLFSLAKLAINTTGALSGLGSASSAFFDVTILWNEAKDIEKRYNELLIKVAEGDVSEETVNNLKNSFTVLKNMYVKIFDLMSLFSAENEDWRNRGYYNYLSTQLQMADMTWSSNGYSSYKDYMNYVADCD